MARRGKNIFVNIIYKSIFIASNPLIAHGALYGGTVDFFRKVSPETEIPIG